MKGLVLARGCRRAGSHRRKSLQDADAPERLFVVISGQIPNFDTILNAD